MSGKSIRLTSTKKPDPKNGVWEKMAGLPGEATRTPRRCPCCGQAFYRTHCPNSRCRRNGLAPQTRPIAARLAQLEATEVTAINEHASESPLNHTMLEGMANRLERKRVKSSVPLSKRAAEGGTQSEFRRDPINRVS